jgi:plastocyanin
MRRLLLPLAFLLIALAAAACAGSAGPGWTYAPPTEPPAATPVPSGDASEAPGSEAPSSEAPSDDAGGTVLQLSAINVDWEQKELSAPADTAFTIHFNNKDANVPHDVVIRDAGGMEMFRGQLTTGPQEIDYQVPALAAGSYQFICSVHPNMIGTLTVGG